MAEEHPPQANPPPPTTSKGFLDLPAEVRLSAYEHFADVPPYSLTLSARHERRNVLKTRHSLLFVSRLINREWSEIFYSTVTFRIWAPSGANDVGGISDAQGSPICQGAEGFEAQILKTPDILKHIRVVEYVLPKKCLSDKTVKNSHIVQDLGKIVTIIRRHRDTLTSLQAVILSHVIDFFVARVTGTLHSVDWKDDTRTWKRFWQETLGRHDEMGRLWPLVLRQFQVKNGFVHMRGWAAARCVRMENVGGDRGRWTVEEMGWVLRKHPSSLPKSSGNWVTLPPTNLNDYHNVPGMKLADFIPPWKEKMRRSQSPRPSFILLPQAYVEDSALYWHWST